MASYRVSRLPRQWQRRVWPAGLSAAILMLVLWASPASSHNFRGCADPATEPCFANNSTHYFSYNLNASGGRWRAAVEFTRVNSYETTDLTTALAPHEASDVYYYIDNTDRGAYGHYYCLYPEAGRPRVCHHAHIWFNDSYSMTQDQRISVACHETGHSLGLRHPNDASPPAPDDPSVYQCMVVAGFPIFLGPHNTAHINSRY
jgi:hypothetical protein